MFGWISSAIDTASSTESTLPNTCDCALVTGGGGDVAGGTTGGAVCVGGGVWVGGGAVGAWAMAFVVATTRAAPASSNRAPILITLALPGPERDPVTCHDRETRRGYHAPLDEHPRPRHTRRNGARVAMDESWISPGRRGNGRWIRFCLTDTRYCVVESGSPQDLGGAPNAAGDPSHQSRPVDRARPARSPRALPPSKRRGGHRDAGGNVLAGRGFHRRGRGQIRPEPGGGSGGRRGLLRHDGGRAPPFGHAG